MRVLLIASDDVGAFDKGSAKTYPKLGLLSLAASLRAALPGLDIRIHDMLLENLTFDMVRQEVAAWRPDIVGVSALSYSEEAFHRVAAEVKVASKDTKVIGGGAYVSSSRLAVLRDPNVDLLVFDEGEVTFAELVKAIAQNTPVAQVQGIGYRDGTVATATSGRALIEDLDTLPMPAYDLVDFDAYSAVNPHLDNGRRFAPIVTSRGCPFRCIYCHALHGKSARFRSADSILNEIEHLYREYDVRLFYIYDDIFNLDKRRAKDICRGIISRGLDIGIDFLNGLRGDMMDRELIQLMLDAGTYYFAYAVETATPRLQDFIEKHNDLDRLHETIDTTVRLSDGRAVIATYNMIGFPSETEDEVWNTILFNRSLGHQIADVAITIPQENTKLFTIAKNRGYEPTTSRTLNYGKNIPLSASEHMDRTKLAELRDAFKRDFYNEDRRNKLIALANVKPVNSSQTFLGAFIRGYMRLSETSLGFDNITLRSGLSEVAAVPNGIAAEIGR
jgi:anaerobic magnesium-protoporphyrin IX monomethyl ester cyclase